jgi:hypothetical protein
MATQADEVQRQGARRFVLTSFFHRLFPTILLFDIYVSYLPNTYLIPAVNETLASIPCLRFPTPST